MNDNETNDSRDPFFPDVSRREFIATVGAGVATTAALETGILHAETIPAPTADHEPTEGSRARIPISLEVNGTRYELAVEPRWTLATVLRRELGLTGTKVVCDRGECGGCTVVRDGQLIYSCMTLAVECDQAVIETIEGVAHDGKLHPVQEAFIENDAYQCGYCTSAMVMSVKHLLEHQPQPSLDDVQQAVSGNLCRCGTYPNVFKAALSAAEKMKQT